MYQTKTVFILDISLHCRPMKYYIIAGEASGDLHGSNLVHAIRRADSDAIIRGWGGDKMSAAGVHIVKHISELAFMGFAEVVRNLPAILKNFRLCKEDIRAFKPDVLVLVDYPGFNLRIAQWAKQSGVRVVYYISPQIWAWKEGRIKTIKRSVDLMLVIFPFERSFYDKWNYKVEYVGHPLVPVIEDYIKSTRVVTNPKQIALLPGSRKQEIRKKLPVMLEATRNFTGHTFLIAKAPGLDAAFYKQFLTDFPNVTLAEDAYDILYGSAAALVTSGTATLETALLKVPQVVCYKTSRLSYMIGKMLVRLKYICIVNLIMDKEVVTELIQDEMTSANITVELNSILYDENQKDRIGRDYLKLRELLSFQGNASDNAAAAILELTRKEP